MVEQMTKYIDARNAIAEEVVLLNNTSPNSVNEDLVREKLGDNKTILLRGGKPVGPPNWNATLAYLSNPLRKVGWHGTYALSPIHSTT